MMVICDDKSHPTGVVNQIMGKLYWSVLLRIIWTILDVSYGAISFNLVHSAASTRLLADGSLMFQIYMY